jgi:hypothetical protein
VGVVQLNRMMKVISVSLMTHECTVYIFSFQTIGLRLLCAPATINYKVPTDQFFEVFLVVTSTRSKQGRAGLLCTQSVHVCVQRTIAQHMGIGRTCCKLGL